MARDNHSCWRSFGLILALTFPSQAGAQPLTPLPTSETVLLGRFVKGPFNLPLRMNEPEFETTFGSANPAAWPAEIQARQFFANGGTSLHVIRIAGAGSLRDALVGNPAELTGLWAVAPLSDARLVIAPELSLLNAGEFAAAFAAFHNFLSSRGIFLILDPPPGLTTVPAFTNWAAASLPGNASGCAIYYPYLQVQIGGDELTVPASGAMAAVYALNDGGDGIWHAPAGSSFPLAAATTTPVLTTGENDSMNIQQLNAIRVFPGAGVVPWGSRTLDRSDAGNRFIAVVRTRQWITASLERSLAFAATNDNDTPLWTRMRSSSEAFLQTLFTQGAFAGATPSQAYFVRCDSTTTTAADIALHRVNLLFGIAPLRPSEFETRTITLPTYDPSRAPFRPVMRARLFQGEPHLSFPTEPGFNYELQSAAGDDAGEWEETGNSVAGDGAWLRSVEPATVGNRFYRVRVTAGR